MKHTLSIGSILSGSELEDFLENMDEAAADWLGLDDDEMKEASHITVTFETPD